MFAKFPLTLHHFTPKSVSAAICFLTNQLNCMVYTFISITVSSEMEVVDVPLNKPVITEIKSHYKAGDMIRGNCTAQYSRPASNLTWLINDNAVGWITWHYDSFELCDINFLSRCQQITTMIRQYPSVKDETRNLFSNTIGLFLRLSQQHFANGRLKVRIIQWLPHYRIFTIKLFRTKCFSKSLKII